MADFGDVVKQLKDNNDAEKQRDSNLNRNIANLRESNKEAFNQFLTAQSNTTKQVEDMVDSEKSNKAAEVENTKDANFKDEKQLTLLQKLGDGLKSIGKSMKDSFTAVTGGSGAFGKFIRGTLLAGLFIAISKFLQSPLFGKMIKFITETLIPKLKFFYDGFFGPKGGFSEGFSRLFSDDSGIGSIVLGITGVVAALAVFKIAKLFKKIAGGVSKLGGFLSSVGSKLGGMKLPGSKGGLPGSKGGLPAVPTKAKGIVSTAGNFAKQGASAGKGIGTFISGILKGVASGLAAIANPVTLVGLAAVVLAINGIALAIRLASPAFEPIGALLEKFGKGIREAFNGIGAFVESTGKSIKSVIVGIGEAIGNVVDKISSMSTAGTEATTKQIKELSKIPSDKMFSAAKGIDAMKKALDGFGGGTFSKIAGNLFGGNGPIQKILDLAKDVPALLKAAEALNVIAAVGGNFAMAEAELKRRKKVAELEKKLAGKYSGFNTEERRAKDQAELDALKKQGISSNQSSGSGLVNTSTTAKIAAEAKANAMMQSGNNKGGGTTIINNDQSRRTNNNSQQVRSESSPVMNIDPGFQSAAKGALN